MTDLVSIIVPIYRIEQYLEQCIQSIQNQTYKNIEIILVDDGSDDQCPQICDRYAREDRRIKVIHKKNGGLDSARKAGIQAATGKYVGYVDGDDWVEPDMYEELLRLAREYDVEVVESGVIDSWINGEKKRVVYLEEGCYKGNDFTEKVEPKLLYAGIFFEHGVTPYMWDKLFLREKIIKYQMMTGLANILHDDLMVSLPCIAESKKLYISHGCHYHYRVRTESLKRKKRSHIVKNLFTCYPEFYVRFRGTTLCSPEDKQIKYFVMYWLLLRAPYVFDDLDEGEFLTQFGKVKIDSKLVLYGAGTAGIQLEDYIRGVKESNLVCWADRNYEDLQRTLNVISPREIVNFEYDYIILSILRETAVKSAKKDLINLGVPEHKILWIDQRYINNPDLLLAHVEYQGKKLVDSMPAGV